MDFGFSLSNNQGMEDVQDVLTLAKQAEEFGFDSVWASEHVFNASYVYDRIGDRPYYEPLAILSYVAATTSKILLGTSVLVIPYHNPIRLAKTAATLDAMSGGRLMLGIGVGVIEQEMEAMGVPFAERGAYTDEAIAVMRELWTQEDPSFEGRFNNFSGMKFSPKPAQRSGVPLIIGGTSRAAIRRAGRVGDGWHPTALPPEELSQAMRYLRERTEAAGRDPSAVPVSVSIPMGEGREGRFSLGNKAAEILQKARAFEDIGVRRIVVSPNTREAAEMLPAMEMLASEVLPEFR
jgi:probable F420-dependent oxidoreductase